MTQLGAPGLRMAGVVFIDLWYHMKPREPLPCVGKALGKFFFLPEELQKPAVLPPEYTVDHLLPYIKSGAKNCTFC